MTKRGIFICIEGIDASGKSTQARRLVRHLCRRGFDAIYTTEPSNGEVGSFIKRYVLQRKRRVPAVVEALLFAVDRVDHNECEIEPALESGQIVVSDRYIYSSLAYQGAAGLRLDWLEKVNEFARQPDLAVFIDVKPETVMSRLKPKKSVMENLETQQKVRKMYLKFVEEGRLTRINGDKSKTDVAIEVYDVVTKFLNKAR